MAVTPTRIHLCGRLAVEWEGEQLERRLPGRQGRLLFAYLVLERDRPVRRDELVEVLWAEEGPPPSGDALLSPPLSRLRKALGAGRLAGREELSLRLPDDAWVDWEVAHADLGEARAGLDAGDWQRALDAARATLTIAERGLLPGLEARWIDERRTELEDVRLEALEAAALAGVRLGGAELAAAERAARAAVDSAPFRESARAALIEALRAQGNVAEALRAYEEVRVLLREELGAAPGPALQALHEQLLGLESAAPVAPARRPVAAPAPPAPSLPPRLEQVAATPLVGRAEALSALRAAGERAAGGETVVALVFGEGGIGKTRLLSELAREHEGPVLYGRCDEEEVFPYGPWVELLEAHLDRVPDGELKALLGADADELVRLVPALARRIPECAAAGAGESPESDRRRLFAAVTSVIARLAAAAPVLLVLDDLHWADRSSLLLLRHLAREEAGAVFVAGTYRDTHLTGADALLEVLADLERERPPVRVGLEGLDEACVAALVERWRGEAAPDADVRAIHAETAGNPFFVTQLARNLGESGVPAGVRDVIARRVARLPDEAGRVLRTAALAGRDFRLEVLERVVDLPEDELLDHLDAAVRAGLLTELADEPGRYSFTHALLRTTLEHDLTATRRARLHRRIGEAIEHVYRDRLGPWLGELARHFAAAGPDEVDRAVGYAVRAAEHATASLAYDEAVELLAQAVELREREDPVDEAERGRLLEQYALALWRAGRWDDARDVHARAAAAARAAGATVLFARAALGNAGLWERFGRSDPQGLALIEEALDNLDEEDAPLRAQLLARFAALQYHAGDPDDAARPLAREAVAMARRLGDEEALAAALAAAQLAAWRPGGTEERLALTEELVAVTTRLEHPELVMQALGSRGLALLELGRLAQADRDLRRYEQLAEQLQQPELRVHARAFRAMRALLEGRWADAERAASEILEIGHRTTHPDALQSYAIVVFVLRAEQLRLGEVVEQLEHFVRELGALPAWRAPLAWAYVQAGRPDDARAELDVLRADDFALLPRDASFAPGLTFAAHMARELGDAALAGEIEPLLRPSAGTWVVLGPGRATFGPVDLALGLCGLTRGDAATAAPDLEAALDLATRMGARPSVAAASLALAEALRDIDPDRARELERSGRELAEQLEMARLLRTADRAH